MPNHLFVELTRSDDDVTAYRLIENHIKEAVLHAAAHGSGSLRPIVDAAAELTITDECISNARTGEIYQLPPELVEALQSAKKAYDLNAFVFRRVPKPDHT